jgi:hypothetical protein
MVICRGCNERIWQFEIDSDRATRETEESGYHAKCMDSIWQFEIDSDRATRETEESGYHAKCMDKIEPCPVWAIDGGRD